MNERASKSNRKIILIALMVVVLLFGFCFAMAPLYSLLCKATGTNTSQRTSVLLEKPLETVTSNAADVDKTRAIKVQFTTSTHMGLAWDFIPNQKSVTVHPGERVSVTFHAKNTTNRHMTVQAVPSLTPTVGLNHFHKIECFCFNQQSLKAGESRDMGLVFQIDKHIPKDIQVLTLAYTLFDATTQSERKV